MNEKSLVNEDVYVFTAHVADDGAIDDVIAVVFLPHADTPSARVTAALTTHLDRDPSPHRVWFVTHKPLATQLDAIANDPDLQKRVEASGLSRHSLVITATGEWLPHGGLSDDPVEPGPATEPVTAPAVITAGLRRQFCDTRSLLTAHGRFHFGKPGRSHAKHFLRAQPAVARDAHAHFVAAALMRKLDIARLRRVWIDTSGIVSVAGALGAVRALHVEDASQLLVDSFGGYDGWDDCKDSVSTDDAVIISSSTSGTLAQIVMDHTGLGPGRVSTLFYLAAETPGVKHERQPLTAPDGVVCDLTLRAPSRDQTFIPPFVSYPPGDCTLCTEEGEPAVPLEGDGFLPVTGTLTARRITMLDGSDQLSSFVQLSMGLDVLRVRHNTRGRTRTVATTIRPLLESGQTRFLARVDEMLLALRNLKGKRQPPIDCILHSRGDESELLATSIGARIEKETGRVVPQHPANTDTIGALLASMPLPRHILVVCAVASSGRTLLDISRQLRDLPATATSLSYLVAVAHPESDDAWRLTTSSLEKRSSNVSNGYQLGWLIDREASRSLGAPSVPFSSSDPWEKESDLLRGMIARRGETDETYDDSLARRLRQLEELTSTTGPKQLFVGDQGRPLPQLNPHFVFWKFQWSEATPPTEEQVYWTITSVIQRSRWRGNDVRYAHVSAGGQHFVIEPAMFDRFNDPVIQASILRAASDGELDYSTDDSRSRFARDLVKDAAQHAHSERGAALNEFLISLALGQRARDGRHLRLKPVELLGLVDDLGQLDLSPLSSELLLDLRVSLGLESSARPRVDPDDTF